MAMLTLREYTYPQLKEKLYKSKKIVVVSCDSCSRLSDGLGGRDGMDSLGDKLEADGFDVTFRCLLEHGCHGDYMETLFAEEDVKAAMEEGEVILPLMCLGGERKMGTVVSPEKFFKITRSVGKGPHDTPDGVRLTKPFESAPVEVDDPEKGISLPEAARQLGIESGPY